MAASLILLGVIVMRVLCDKEVEQISGGNEFIAFLLLTAIGFELYNGYRINKIEEDVDNLIVLSMYQELQLTDLPGYEESLQLTYVQVLDKLFPNG